VKRLIALVPLVPILLTAPGCSRALPPPDVIAEIAGGEPVRAAAFEAYLATSAGTGSSGLSNEVLSRLLDQFLSELLLRRLAVERGAVAQGAPVREAVSALIAGERAAEPVSARDVAEYYMAHLDQFDRPERLRLRQILTADRAAAERARAEVLAGADFATVARRLSRDAHAQRGGFQGELSRDDLPAAFADLLFGLAPGALSPVLDAPSGYHVFQVEAHLPPRRLELAEAEAEIRATLERERADRALAALVTEARRRYTLVIHARNLPFDYEPPGPSAAR
jgi:parvulin-like peptidyl-prolyl isomerase